MSSDTPVTVLGLCIAVLLIQSSLPQNQPLMDTTAFILGLVTLFYFTVLFIESATDLFK